MFKVVIDSKNRTSIIALWQIICLYDNMIYYIDTGVLCFLINQISMISKKH